MYRHVLCMLQHRMSSYIALKEHCKYEAAVKEVTCISYDSYMMGSIGF